MGRRVFQNSAHVLCQKFVEVPSNRDLVNLAMLGDGVLRLDITGRKATHNGLAIEPLPFAEQYLLWKESRLIELAIFASRTSARELDCRKRGEGAWEGRIALPLRRPCPRVFSVRPNARSRIRVDSDRREIMGTLEASINGSRAASGIPGNSRHCVPGSIAL